MKISITINKIIIFNKFKKAWYSENLSLLYSLTLWKLDLQTNDLVAQLSPLKFIIIAGKEDMKNYMVSNTIDCFINKKYNGKHAPKCWKSLGLQFKSYYSFYIGKSQHGQRS